MEVRITDRTALLRFLALWFCLRRFLDDFSLGTALLLQVAAFKVLLDADLKYTSNLRLTQPFSGRFPAGPGAAVARPASGGSGPKIRALSADTHGRRGDGRDEGIRAGLQEGEIQMGLWLIPFVGISILVLGGLSLVVVEYQDQKARRFEGFRNLK
jgi:hypothetical protein